MPEATISLKDVFYIGKKKSLEFSAFLAEARAFKILVPVLICRLSFDFCKNRCFQIRKNYRATFRYYNKITDRYLSLTSFDTEIFHRIWKGYAFLSKNYPYLIKVYGRNFLPLYEFGFPAKNREIIQV